jgi:hypothetical protein
MGQGFFPGGAGVGRIIMFRDRPGRLWLSRARVWRFVWGETWSKGGDGWAGKSAFTLKIIYAEKLRR